MTQSDSKTRVDPFKVHALMKMYPNLDYLLAETILSFTEEELGEMLKEKYVPKLNNNASYDEASEIES
jgi:hypothetical protein